MSTSTRREEPQEVKTWVIGVIDDQEPRLITITQPVFSGLEGVVLVGKAPEPCVTSLCILFSTCVNPEDAPEPIRACQLHISDDIEEQDWQKGKVDPTYWSLLS